MLKQDLYRQKYYSKKLDSAKSKMSNKITNKIFYWTFFCLPSSKICSFRRYLSTSQIIYFR